MVFSLLLIGIISYIIFPLYKIFNYVMVGFGGADKGATASGGFGGGFNSQGGFNQGNSGFGNAYQAPASSGFGFNQGATASTGFNNFAQDEMASSGFNNGFSQGDATSGNAFGQGATANSGFDNACQGAAASSGFNNFAQNGITSSGFNSGFGHGDANAGNAFGQGATVNSGFGNASQGAAASSGFNNFAQDGMASSGFNSGFNQGDAFSGNAFGQGATANSGFGNAIQGAAASSGFNNFAQDGMASSGFSGFNQGDATSGNAFGQGTTMNSGFDRGAGGDQHLPFEADPGIKEKRTTLVKTMYEQADRLNSGIKKLQNGLLEKKPYVPCERRHRNAVEESSRVQKLKADLDAVTAEREIYKAKCEEEAKLLQKMRSELDTMAKGKKTMNSEVSEEVSRFKKMKAELDAIAEEKADLKAKLDSAIEDKQALQQTIRTLEDSKYSSEIQVQLLEKELSPLKKKVSQMEAEGRRQVDSLRELTRSKEDLNSRLKITEEHLGEARGGYREVEELKGKLDAKSKEKRALQKKLDAAVEEKVSVQRAWKELDQQYEAMEKIKNSHQTRAELLETELSHLKRKFDSSQSQLDQLADLARNKDDVSIRLRTTEEHLDEVRRDRLFLQKQLEDAEGKLEQSEQACRKLQSAMRDALDKITYNKNEKEHFEKLYEAMEKSKNSYLTKAETLETEISQLKRTDAMHISKSHLDQLANLARSKDDMSARLRTTEAQLDEVHRDHLILQKQLEDAERKLEQSEHACRKLQSAMGDALDKITYNKNEKDHFEKLYEAMEKSKNSYQTKVESLETELSHLKRSDAMHVNKIQVDPPVDLARSKDDMSIRLRMTEEHLGEVRRDYLILQEQLEDAEGKLEQSEQACKKLQSAMREALDKITYNKNEKEYFEKLYESYKEKTQVDLLQKDAKIAQQDKLITHLQRRIPPSKKMCCFLQDRRPAGRLSIDDLGRALDSERSKNVELKCMVRRLQQQLTEKRMRRSFSEERFPIVNEN